MTGMTNEEIDKVLGIDSETETEVEKAEPQIRWVIGAFFNSRGFTKNPTLQELRNSRDGNTNSVADTTDEALVRQILLRANLAENPRFAELVEIFSDALVDKVSDPITWMNPNYGKFQE